MRKDKPDEGQWVPVKIAADEELNTAKLDDLKNALDDLKIVDASRKPAGLSADLKTAADFTGKEEAFLSLAEKGFFLAPVGENGPVELFSNEGEVRVIMKDGVEYVLRFGEIAGAGSTKKKGKSDEAEKKGADVNRYLFVMAEFDPNVIPKPQLDPLPPAGKDAEKKPDSAKKADDKKAQSGERERVEKENKRKREEYEQKIADGKKRVSELNARFADWYYVISDDVFRKIHLGHDEVFKKKEKPKDEAKTPGKESPQATGEEPAKQPADKPAAKGKAAAKNESTPAAKLEDLQKEGPAGKK
jgi:hypothetical protein